MEAVALLRDLLSRGDLDGVAVTADEVVFPGGYAFPASAPTPFLSKSGVPYSLAAVAFLLLNSHLKVADYLRLTRIHSIPTVAFLDRATVLSLDFDPLPLHADESDDGGPYSDDGARGLPGDRAIRALERPFKDREAILEVAGRDFYAVYLGAIRREEDRQRGQQRPTSAAPAAPKAAPAAAPRTASAGLKLKPGTLPIILVPSASQTLITIYNVKEFLENGVFVPSEELARQASERPVSVMVHRKLTRGGEQVAAFMEVYEVRDKPSSLRPEDWDRVAAVFVLGKEWQFKDWPIVDHVDIFNKYLGFFIRFEDDSLESAKLVKQWNVKIISISKNKRHQDRAAALEIWDRLDEFARSRRLK